ncbi:unnamed protein product [Phytomonas sp. Hart1]|nr:unnamed protein product [Phytomonas sp. Hart1]|eukprot:CCW71104.1 unnamed protein product [Phytomonas sp. isolate Hart1]
MFRKSIPFLHIVLRSALIKSHLELHRLLDTINHSSVDLSIPLKRFLQKDLIPFLEGTSLEQRQDIKEMQEIACQIMWEAAFAAQLLQASPNGRYVAALQKCILHDHERMHFLHRMTSADASKIIENLCNVGVRDHSVYNVLISKLDFHGLRQIARAMFAFASVGLHELTIRSVVPLYCDEKWALAYELPPEERLISRNTKSEDLCNVFEAVRVLRVLSTSLRSLVFLKKASFPICPDTPHLLPDSDTLEDLPNGNINKIRNRLCVFILENDFVMRGGHWINFVRALVNFPKEYQVLDGLNQDPHFPSVISKFAADITRDQAVNPADESTGRILNGGAITGYDLALIGIAKIFDFVEGRRTHLADKTPSGMANNSFPQSSPGRLIVNSVPFDCGLLDLVKLIPLLDLISCAKSKQESRLLVVLETLLNHSKKLQFGGLVKLMNTLHLMGTTFNAKGWILKIAEEADKLLLTTNTQSEIGRIRVASLFSFTSILYEYNIRSCNGFVKFMEHASPILPTRMNPFEVAHCLSLISLPERGPSKSTRSIVWTLLGKLRQFWGSHERRAGALSGSLSCGLLAEYPVPCMEILRAMMRLEVIPEEDDLWCFFGSPVGFTMPNEKPFTAFRNVSALILADLSRVIASFGRLAGLNVEDDAQLTKLRSWGVLNTLLPLLTKRTEELAESATTDRAEVWGKNSVLPFAWSGTIKTVFYYVDLHMTTCSFEMMSKRLDEVHTLTKNLAVFISRCTDVEISNSYHDNASDQVAGEPQKFSYVHFHTNMVAQMFIYMLIWEFMLFEGSWSAKQRLLTTNLRSEDKKAAEKILEMKEDYIEFLKTPLPNNSNNTKTPMDIMQHGFGITKTGVNESSPITRKPLLDKSLVLEITNFLPFGVSLVLNPGPVNEFFSEQSGSLIVN